MTEKSANIKDKSRKMSSKSIFRKIRKIFTHLLIFILASLLIVSLSFIFLSQTKVFRSWFYGKVLELVNEELEGRIEASDIKISPFEGIQIWDLRIIVSGDTLAAADKITINYAFTPILSQYLYIKSISVDKPRIKLIRNQQDSSWNFEHLVKPSTDTSPSAKLDWVFDLQNLILKNGSVIIYDPLSDDENNFSPTNAQLNNLNLLVQAKADLVNDKYYFAMKELMFYERSTDLDVRDLEFKLNVDSAKVILSNGFFRSNYLKAEFNLSADKLNIFEMSDSTLENAWITFDFDSEYINLIGLNKFSSAIPEIKDDIEIDFSLAGNTKTVEMNNVDILKAGSNVSLKAKVDNPLEEDNVRYSLKMYNSELNDNDFTIIKKALNLENINIGLTKINYAAIDGNRDLINSKIDIMSSYGNLKGKSQVDLKNIQYSADLIFSKINPSGLLNEPGLAADLTGKLSVSGSGFEPKSISADINLALQNSELSDYHIKSLNFAGSVTENLAVVIDSLNLSLVNTYTDSLIQTFSKTSDLSLNGNFNLSDISNPEYELNLNLHEFNLASLLKFNLAPQYMDAKINVKGKGFHPDSIETNLKADIQTCMFGNRTLLPFGIELISERFGGKSRQILLNSELFQLELIGEYQLNDFISLAEYQIGELVTLINRRVFAFEYDNLDSLNKYFSHRKLTNPRKYTMDLRAKLTDITPIGIAVGQPNLYGKADVEIYVDVNDKYSIIDLRKFDVESFQYKDGLADISVSPTEITGYIKIDMKDSMPVFSRVNLTMDASSNTYVNGMAFSKPKLWFDFRGEKLDFRLNSTLNDFLYTDAKGYLNFNPGEFILNLDTTNISVGNEYIWNSAEPILVKANKKGLTFDNFKLSRLNSETIELKGSVNSDFADNLLLTVHNFPLYQIKNYMPPAQKKFAESLKGYLKNASVTINDSILSPRIECTFETDNVYSDNTNIGIFKGSASYSDRLLTGTVNLTDSTAKTDLLNININSLPIDLAMKTGGKRIHGDYPIDISAKAFNLPLEIVNPFLPDVISDMRGIADAEFSIVGNKDDVDYLGSINAKRARFLSNVNNLYYSVQGNLDIQNENIRLENITAENDPSDLRGGRANVDGTIVFRDFTIEEFDLTINSPGVKLLGMKSIKSMPSMYGDFIIASGEKPINFSGSFTKPYLAGDIDILRAKIYMPTLQSKDKAARSLFKYEVKGNNLVVENITRDSLLNYIFDKQAADTVQLETESNGNSNDADFADLLKYDLNIRFINPMEIYMDLGGQLGQIFAVVSTKVPGTKLAYIVDPEIKKAMIIGDLELKQNSTFTYIKPFNITGGISFPTGNMDNPSLDLKAAYYGRTTREDYIRNYTVNMYIRGTKNRPIITFDYLLDNEPAKGDTAKIREDALFLLMFGLTKSEFEQPSSGTGAADALGAGGSQYVASILSRSVTEMLSGTGFISNADIDLQGGSFQNAKLKLSGQILGMTWNVGGSIADVMNGYEFTAEVPLGLVLDVESFRSVFLSFATSYNPSQNVSRNQKNWEVKIKWGNDF